MMLQPLNSQLIVEEFQVRSGTTASGVDGHPYLFWVAGWKPILDEGVLRNIHLLLPDLWSNKTFKQQCK